jgi:hypothetical protein
MQGQYNGFLTWLGKVSPEKMHVWCNSHISTLDTKTLISAAIMFSLMNSLAVF